MYKPRPDVPIPPNARIGHTKRVHIEWVRFENWVIWIDAESKLIRLQGV